MNPRRKFGIDKDKEQKGLWFTIPGDREGDEARVRIARAGNPEFQAKQEYLVRRRKEELDSANLPDAEREKILRQCVAETVLLGWEGFTDEAGEVLRYTPDESLRLLSDAPEFYSWVLVQATNAENFRLKAEEARLKNS